MSADRSPAPIKPHGLTRPERFRAWRKKHWGRFLDWGEKLLLGAIEFIAKHWLGLFTLFWIILFGIIPNAHLRYFWVVPGFITATFVFIRRVVNKENPKVQIEIPGLIALLW